jgi:trigger factor
MFISTKRINLLKIEKEIRDDHQVKLTVEIDAEPFEKAKHRAARQIAKRIKIPGFRPGKAPYGVILRQVGEGQVVEQALDFLIEEQYPEIIKEAEIDPYGPGTLDNVPELDPPTFEFIVPLQAEVELGEYKSISIKYEPPTTGDAEVDEAVEQAREQQAAREKVDRPAEEGDVVFMRVSGVRTEVEEDEEGTILEERFSSSVIQEAKDEEFPFPGFSQELIGLSTETEKTIPYQYPDDHEDEKLHGVKAEFTVTVTNIQSVVLPDIDDELAKKAGEFDTLEEWRSDIKVKLEENALLTYADEYDDQVIDQIVADSTIKYPPQMIEKEKEDIIQGLEYRLSQQGLTKELYMQIRGQDEEGLNEEVTPVAEKRVTRALVLFEIAKLEEIEIDKEKVKAETGRTINAISSSMTPKEAKKFARSNYVPNLITNIAADMTTKTTMEFLRATAQGLPWPPEEETKDDESDNEAPIDGTIEVEEEPTIDSVEEKPETEIEQPVEEDVPPTDSTPEAPDDEVVSDEIETGAEDGDESTEGDGTAET